VSADRQTLTVYDAQAEAYAARRDGWIEPGLPEFMAQLPAGGSVLDLGCGPGDSALNMQQAGFRVDAVDASAEMVKAANALGVNARQATFDEIEGEAVYDGVWASYSLLHAPREAMPGHLARLRRALKPGGYFHIGMKLGTGAKRDPLGRLYTYYGEDELEGLLRTAGLTPVARELSSGIGLDQQEYFGIWMQANG
jgi:SAM-dependent methyltransferase